MKNPEQGDRVGLVVVLTGNGKGKTTSALGMALRATGHGLRACIIQFMKGDLYTGEIDGVRRLAPLVELHQTGKGFCGIQGNPYPHHEHRANAQSALELAREKILSGEYEIIILDEINNALKLRLVDLDQVLGLLDARPAALHLILTGRDAHADVCARAHTITEMNEIRHAYRDGISVQPGIDY